MLAELLEALADAGLSEAVLTDDRYQPPAIIQARLAESALRGPIWPDLRACVVGLQGRPALLLRRQRLLSKPHGAVLSLYLEPPDSCAVKSCLPAESEVRLVSLLGEGDLGGLLSAGVDGVDVLVDSLLPATLRDRLEHGDIESLVVIPDGPLWSVPWEYASVFRNTVATMAPSLSVYARLTQFHGVVRTVTAFVDHDAPCADVVVGALNAAEASGQLVVREYVDLGVTEPSDLMLAFAHGDGTGLEFRIGSHGQTYDTLRLATTVRAKAVLLAACWSMAEPPVSFPINASAAMLLSGVSTVIGGLWPVPARATADLIADLVARLAVGEQLMPALAAAQMQTPQTLHDRWGLAVHGHG